MKNLRSTFLVLLACLPCCLPLVGLSGAAVLAAVVGVLALIEAWLGIALVVVVAVALFLLARRRSRRRPGVEPIAFFDSLS